MNILNDIDELCALTFQDLNLLKTSVLMRKICGIYSLYYKGVLQYIGSSKDINQRHEYHRYSINSRKNKLKCEWDEFKYFEYPEDDMVELETKLINYFKPPFNVKRKGGGKCGRPNKTIRR